MVFLAPMATERPAWYTPEENGSSHVGRPAGNPLGDVMIAM